MLGVAASMIAAVGSATVATGQDRGLPVPAVSSGNASHDDGRRYEGYRFLDLEGQALPFQSDEDIEAFLANAEIVETSALGTGITLPRLVVLQGDGFRARAIFKDVDISRHKVIERINGRDWFSLDWRDWHGYDEAAYLLDRLLGLDRVPPTVPREIAGDKGTIRIWLEGTVTELERSHDLHVEPPDIHRWNQQRLMMQIFDDLVANRDSNLGNLLIDPNWHAWFIDCTRCFGTTRAMYYPLAHIDFCERGLWDGLSSLDPEAVRQRLSPYLGKAEITALVARHATIVRHFRKLIDERGEDAVLFDIKPSTQRAPWEEAPTADVDETAGSIVPKSSSGSDFPIRSR